MHRLYWRNYTDLDPNGEVEEEYRSLLVCGPDEKPADENYEYARVRHTLVANEGEVGIEDLLEAVNSDLEGANYHRQIGVLDAITEVISEEAGPQVSRDILLKLVKKNGTVGIFVPNW